MTPAEAIIQGSVKRHQRRLRGPEACDAYIAARIVVDHILENGPGLFNHPMAIITPEAMIKAKSFHALTGFGKWRREKLDVFMKRYK